MKLSTESLKIALEVLDDEEEHAFEDAMNQVHLELAHIESVFVVQKHELRVQDVDPDQLTPHLPFMQYQGHGYLADVEVDGVQHLVDGLVFVLLATLDHHLSAHLHLVLLQDDFLLPAVLQEDSVVQTLPQVVGTQHELLPFDQQHNLHPIRQP